MKKFLAIFAAAAVVAAIGFGVISIKKGDSAKSDEASSASSETEYSSQYSGEDGTSITSQSTEAASQTAVTQQSQASYSRRSFTSQIDSVSGSLMVVVPDKNCVESDSSDKFAFSTDGVTVTDINGKTVSADDIKNFASAKVTYTGEMMETYPVQIKATGIVLSLRQYCNVNFSVNGQIVKSLRVRTGETVNSADMPNAGAYCQDGYHFECWLDGDKSVTSLSGISDSVTLTAKIVED